MAWSGCAFGPREIPRPAGKSAGLRDDAGASEIQDEALPEEPQLESGTAPKWPDIIQLK